MKLVILCLLFSVCLSKPLSEKITNVVVVMMENRAFDHVLGFLKSEMPDLDGLDGSQFNYFNPFDETTEKVFVTDDAPYVNGNFGHSFELTEIEVFGRQDHEGLNVSMNGFIASAMVHGIENPETVMQCFNPKSLPALNGLAKEFAVSDRWHASIPGPTEVNRYYMHTATSMGMANNELTEEMEGMPMRSIFQNLQDNGKSWRIYMEELSTTFFLSQMRQIEYLQNYRFFNQFLQDARMGTLPNYSFIEPRYFEALGMPANDQHPPHNAVYGEMFYRDIYEALRASPQWNSTLLIITHDEHGGLYDHVLTPTTGVPNPDAINSKDPFFDFKRIGVRVPALLISPWIPKGTILNKASGPNKDSVFDHTSTLSFLKRLFNLPEFLTNRDEAAAHFDHIFTLDEPRTDCPLTIPVPPLPQSYQSQHKSPLNDLHQSIIRELSKINGIPRPNLSTQHEASLFIRNQVSKLLQRTKTQ